MTNREIDALVATLVFGGMLVKDGHCEECRSLEEPVYRWPDMTVGPAGRYSDDIAAAWEVIEKLRKEMCCISVYSDHDLVYRVSMTRAESMEEIEAGKDTHVPCAIVDGVNTAPMAICLAALKAVGVEVPHGYR